MGVVDIVKKGDGPAWLPRGKDKRLFFARYSIYKYMIYYSY